MAKEIIRISRALICFAKTTCLLQGAFNMNLKLLNDASLI